MVRLAAPLRPLFPYLKPAYSVGTSLVAPFAVAASKLRGGQLPTGTVADLATAATRSGGRSWVVRRSERIVRPIPPGSPPHPTFLGEAEELSDEVIVAELPGGRVLGPHAAVITRDGDLVDDVSRYFGTTRPSQHPLYLRPFTQPPVDVPGRLGVVAYKGAAVNHYHFLLDTLPRIGIIEQCSELELPDKWYVPASTPNQSALLELMGIDADRRLDSTAFPHVRAEQLVVARGPGDELHPPWTTEFVRSCTLDGTLRRRPGRNLYLTRGRSPNNRSILNEEEVTDALGARGFRSLDPSTIGVLDQIREFAEADVIVSAHGAALANLVFSSPGSLVVEMFPGWNVAPCYWKLAATVPGLTYRFLPGICSNDRSSRARALVQDILVDIPALVDIVDEHLAKG